MRLSRVWASRHLVDQPGAEIALLIGVAAALELAAGTGLAYLAGFAAVRQALAGVQAHWPWLLVLVASLVVSFAGYYFAYLGIFTVEDGPGLPSRHMRGVVTAGFGGFLSHGGGALDSYALRAAGCDDRQALVRVSSLGGMEYGVLSLFGCVAAIVVLAAGRAAPPSDFTLPWAVIPVPGFLIAFYLAGRYRRRLRAKGGLAGKAGIFLEGIYLVRQLSVHPLQHSAAMPGMAVYWAADLAAAWCGLAAFGFEMNTAAFIVAAATGMVFTRRTGPLAGAGVLALVLPLCLWYSGAPLAYAIVGIFAYRILSLWLPLPFTLASLPNLRRMGGQTAA